MIKTVLLAGGLGTRLRPYTTVFPKPMMPIGSHPVLEIVIRQLAAQGFRDIVISVGYLAELIEAYFISVQSTLDVNITYEREESPLGTAGPLGRIPGLNRGTFLVMNGDLLVQGFDFSKFIHAHQASDALVTIARYRRVVETDFGVLEIDTNGNLKHYHEKPSDLHWVSMGIYAYEPRTLEYIGHQEKLDFPDLALRLLGSGEKVNTYHDEQATWLDIGRPEDYEEAQSQAKQLVADIIQQG